jgi:hypothetical protein
MAGATDMAVPEILLARGNIYLSREICEAHLAGVVSVALIARDGNILIVPLTQQSGGGLLLKQRNARGDRVIHAQDFYRAKGLVEDFEQRTLPVCWCQEYAALVVPNPVNTCLPKCDLP